MDAVKILILFVPFVGVSHSRFDTSMIKLKVKLPLCFNWSPRHEGVLGEWRYSFTHSLTSALDRGEWSASRPLPCTHWIGGWMGPRAVLDAVMKRKIPSPRWESKPRTPIVQPVAQSYTDWGQYDKRTRNWNKQEMAVRTQFQLENMGTQELMAVVLNLILTMCHFLQARNMTCHCVKCINIGTFLQFRIKQFVSSHMVGEEHNL
jgi:hypothetical protein